MLAFLQAIKWLIDWLRARAAERAAHDLAVETKKANRMRRKQANTIRKTLAHRLRRSPDRVHDDDGFRRN